MKPFSRRLVYTREAWYKFAMSHKRIQNMRRKLKLPFLIPSINHYYGKRAIKTKYGKQRVIEYLLPESIVFVDFIQHIFKQTDHKIIKEGIEIELRIAAWYKDNRRRDVDNPKAIQDALKGLLFRDDSQVFRLIIDKDLEQEKDEVIISWGRREKYT